MKRVVIATLAVGAVVLSGCSSKGKTREPAELQRIKSPAAEAKLVWRRSLGGSKGLRSGLQIDVQDDALFVAEVGGEVYALDPDDGDTIWRSDTGARLISGPAASGDLVFVGTLDAEVIALSRADGRERWRQTLSSEVLAAPAADGDTVIARTVDGRVFALSADDGSRRWTFDRTVPSLTLRGLARPVIVGPVVLVGFDNGRLAALRLDDGEPLWETTISAPTGRSELERIVDVDADPIATPAGVFALSFGGSLMLIDPRSGDSRWERSIQSYTGGTIFGNRGLAVSDADGLIWALDAETGAAVWKLEDLKYRNISRPVVIGDYLAVADYDGYVHLISLADGRIVGRERVLRAATQAAPVVVGERLYLLDDSGRLVAMELDES